MTTSLDPSSDSPSDSPSDGASSHEFVRQLTEEMEQLFGELGAQETLESESDGQVDVVTLLKMALKSELEASELAAYWMPTTPEVDVKHLFAQQCGDEMKHYQLIAQRLRDLGEDMDSYDPLTDGYTPLYHYLKGLRTTVERVAGGPFTCEAIARVRNRQFIDFCRKVGDYRTADLYETVIHGEEVHHQVLGREALERYCTTPRLQELAAIATRSTLAIADELRTLKEKATGLSAIPVS